MIFFDLRFHSYCHTGYEIQTMAQIAFKQRCKHTLGNQFLNCFHLDKEIANLYEGALKFYYEIGKKNIVTK